MKTKLVCLDLDDTLIRGIHSVMLPCIMNGKEEEHAIIQEQEDRSGKTTLGIELIRRLGCPALILSAQACYPGTVAGTYSGGVFDRRCETRKYSVK